MTHRHIYDRYYPQADRWVCACGASCDRLGRVFDAERGSAFMAAITAPTRDPGVRSGRELLSC